MMRYHLNVVNALTIPQKIQLLQIYIIYAKIIIIHMHNASHQYT